MENMLYLPGFIKVKRSGSLNANKTEDVFIKFDGISMDLQTREIWFSDVSERAPTADPPFLIEFTIFSNLSRPDDRKKRRGFPSL